VKAMSIVEHIIETDEFSGRIHAREHRVERLRRLILIGLAGAMALATLAPVVVLAG
jgi:hypothetical protein